jgi:ParB family chromosome partitioning protein
MARKDVLLSITQVAASSGRPLNSDYAVKGASRSMISSLGELAEKAAQADRLLEGETVVDIDPDLVDGSFVSDRIAEAGEDPAFRELVEAIRERGQDSPILVRPHPSAAGRYQTIFGHRRVRAARELGRPVRAVVKAMDDIGHVVAQGQENSARANLSFIERACFAARLLALGYERQTVQSALATDATLVSRMLSVVERVPDDVLQAIGPAKGIGRDRWLEMAQVIEVPASRASAEAFVGTDEFESVNASDSRFEKLLAHIKRSKKKAPVIVSDKWSASDKGVTADLKSDGKNFTLALKARDAVNFGRYLAANLGEFYEAFRNQKQSNGD